MANYIVDSIEINVSRDAAFKYIGDNSELVEWTNAFRKVEGNRAIMATPAGEIEIGLKTIIDQKGGTIDWIMEFPDGRTDIAYSRLVPGINGTTIFSFVLPLLERQDEMAATLREELARLKRILEQ